MLAENSGTKSAATVLTELSAAHKEESGKFVGYNIDAEQALNTELVGLHLSLFESFLSTQARIEVKQTNTLVLWHLGGSSRYWRGDSILALLGSELTLCFSGGANG